MDETIYRVMTMYVMAQYLRMKKGLRADWDLKDLEKLYGDVKEVNAGFCRRIASAGKKDAVLNSVAHLDIFASWIMMPRQQQADSLAPLFAPYLRGGAPSR
jgi:hypothetical protein